MKQSQVIKEIAQEVGQPQTKVKSVIAALVSEIQNHLLNGEAVEMDGFGTLSTLLQEAKTTTVPGKEGLINIPAHYKVQFKINRRLKEEIKSLKKSRKTNA